MLPQELHKPVIKIFKRGKIYLRFKDNTWAADLAEVVSLSRKKYDVKYFLCVINDFTKYSWVKPLRDKKAEIVLHGFNGIVTESKCKSNKLCVAQEKKIYNSLMQKWLDDNDIWMYLTHNEEISVVAKRLRISLKVKIYQKMTASIVDLISVIWIN